MEGRQVLQQLGVEEGTLSPGEKDFLDEQGYLPLHDVLTPVLTDALAARIDAIAEEEKEQAGRELMESKNIRHPKEHGALRLSDLVNKDPIFEICYTHPRVLAAIAHVLGTDIKLSSLNSRASLPGYGLQNLHADWPVATAPGDYYVCNSIWLLDDFTEENGATRLVPGTHRSGKLPSDVMADPSTAHLEEIQLIAPRGTVVVFNSHTWHGGTLNRSAAPRRAIHSYFCRRDQVQQIEQQRYIRPHTYARMGEAVHWLLDVQAPAE